MDDARDLDATGFEVDNEKHEISNNPWAVSTSTVKKSVAAIAPQWAFTKVLQGVRLSLAGAGSIPCSARMRFTVFLPTSWPMLARAHKSSYSPSPQLEFSFAIVSTSSRIVSITRGRPGPRRWLPSYFAAMNFRYQRNNVSGVTGLAISFRFSRHNAFAFAARRRRWSSVKRRRRAPSCSRSTRFSSFMYSITSCWDRLTQPAKVNARNCHRWGCIRPHSSRSRHRRYSRF